MMNSWRGRIAILTGLALAAVVLVGTASYADTYRVRAVSGDQFMPAVRTIHRGDVIKWVNRDNQAHTVSAYGGNWSKNVVLGPGESTRKKFRRRGTYKYRCRFHSALSGGQCSGMCGRIIVRRG